MVSDMYPSLARAFRAGQGERLVILRGALGEELVGLTEWRSTPAFLYGAKPDRMHICVDPIDHVLWHCGHDG